MLDKQIKKLKSINKDINSNRYSLSTIAELNEFIEEITLIKHKVNNLCY